MDDYDVNRALGPERGMVYRADAGLTSTAWRYATASTKMLNREVIVVAILFVGVSTFGQSAPKSQPSQAAIAISRQEMTSHRIGRQPILRVQLNARMGAELAMEGVTVKAVAGPDGVVTFAKAARENAPPNLLAQAESLVLGMHYQPFERDGHAIWASFEEQVMVLPPELKPARHVPFPEVRDWESVVITLTRTGCLGFCPSYRIEVHGDGAVWYEGKAYVAILGKHQCSIPIEKVRELVNIFREADYYSLQDEYVWEATDLPTYISSIQIDSRSKTVKDYAGVMIGMPLEVSDLESSIDRLAEVQRWTTGDAETVACLRRENWNFKSQEAAKALVGLAEFGNVQAVSDFVAEGVPLNGKDDMRQSPLTRAAFRGDVEMLRVLLEAGAGKQDSLGIGAAFAMASRSGKSEAMKLLLSTGAAGSGSGTDGRTLLMTTAASGVPDIVEDVLKSHPDVNARDKKGRTALIEAVSQYHYGPEDPEIDRAEVVRLLLQAGADPNISDEDGNTALIEAAWDAGAVLLLIREGANVNAQNRKGSTPLMNCADPEVARVLLAHGADPSIRDGEGKTALDLAKQYGMKAKEAVLSEKKH